MNSKALSLFTCFFLLVYIQSRAQDTSSEAVFVTQNGDTIQGVIKFYNNRALDFINKDSEKIYHPKNVKWFKLNSGENYVSGVLPNEFVKQILIGEISMYAFDDYFLLKVQNIDSLITLKQKYDSVTRIEIINYKKVEKVFLKKSVDWLGTLYFLVDDCATIEKKELNFTERNIAQVLIRYHECKKTPYLLLNKQVPFRKFNFGLVLGAMNSNINMHQDDEVFRYYPGNFENTSFTAGFNFYITFPRAMKNFNFSSGLLFSNVKYMGEHTIELLNNHYKTIIDYNLITIPIMMNYEMPLFNKFSLMIGAGFEYNIHMKTQVNSQENKLDANEISILGKRSALDINENQLGVSYRIGAYKHFKRTKLGFFVSQTWSNSFGKGFYNGRFLYTASNQISKVGIELIL